MRRSLAKFSESEASNHPPSLADFTTTTPELKFSVHTGPHASIPGEGCAGLARRRAGWTNSLPPNSRRATSRICSNLIYGGQGGRLPGIWGNIALPRDRFNAPANMLRARSLAVASLLARLVANSD